ncbi:hypothetical protein L249_6604 [Ophiocordyceps polyrhachis-furcata BCC 54312]|uniref:Uncharacterized protein n=1 Tax=Ophiocordyceps polyrhachis-furcata BCC 54312 TaxID=1330021 RepID=A0A367LLQ3_9HYPO|nr:hypothetical protein L249_6604 [Ophiocordyceps polyrhachis-furcata BCC 54312]
MPPTPRRRSARLAKTPKVTVEKELPSVAEEERESTKTPSRSAAKPTPKNCLSTPVSSAIKPSHDEMHPSKARPTVGEASSALRLGFSDIPSDGRAGPMATPSKTITTAAGDAPAVNNKGLPPSSPFSFRFAREAADTALSNDARRMMDEIRGQAVKIKADLLAQQGGDGGQPTSISGRVFAKLKGAATGRGRFSAAHTAEFDKMDSIEGHASAWRAQNGRFTPATSGLKHSPSKNTLDGSGLKPSPSKTDLQPKRNLKRTSSIANLDYGGADNGRLPNPPSGVKRMKQRPHDDSSTCRPVSRDASALPRPVSSHGSLSKSRSGNLARLMSPTKASLAHSTDVRKPVGSLTPSPSKTSLRGLAKSASTTKLPSDAADTNRPFLSPGRFQKVKSILRGQRLDLGGGGGTTATTSIAAAAAATTTAAKSAIPQPAAVRVLQTPDPPLRTDKALPAVALTTPRRKLPKRVDFTPGTNAKLSHASPSPLKSNRPPLREIDIGHDELSDDDEEEEDVLNGQNQPKGNCLYPDLSPLRRLVGTESPGNVRGTFTFRSEHQCKFEDARHAKPSIRRVRESAVPVTDMPGSFPAPPSPSCHPNKENTAPSPTRLLPGTAHGMHNKKRHRAKSDEEDADEEAAARAMKKRKKAHVPEGQALLAPRLVSGHKRDRSGLHGPGRKPGWTASPGKKSVVLSKSRLDVLARPKNRGSRK